MKHITFYLDFISPYAYLAFEKLPEALKGISYSVTYKPLLFAGLLKHHGQLGPAEIASKREWTYRQVLWLAQQQGITLKLPASHPFNPLALLRLAAACDVQGTPNRYVCETIFRHVWQSGLEAADAQRTVSLATQLAPPRDINGADVKAQLSAHSDEAIAHGVFGVPTMLVDGKLFWGLDALSMLRGYLLGESWFAGADWDAASQLPAGIQRQK
ncbi:MAG: 2-hydroxychromene-2-carboxylate isomerase [Polaromonas sp.]|uniref:2-hydroxychromene-2-carboxylate isomerase n=1 Tax=Polaromonas sp. TaxID=1869339 RepID=UPI00273079AE|nr:2-hydroxychromene-2-carboxylate isomerase [Polaromonas sp.]MDP1740694.1 2-hydroxychromene-2-carboxylate isomerase [Polaromonas sp.]MDP1954778.1 2-hydroxychromene-2-carboxylate isomerase [Polaromonas sp.]MDP3356835.1 2-hydroxychromene-2-carboxylate isomerase [Polaromonas sp.]MDP3751025.1 2-hydroxychromene-2-carboxylate isomerase [Polaromonas sp.]